MSPITKRDILPVIIMSNYTPEECFPSANEHGKLEPLLDRITVVKCEGQLGLLKDSLQKILQPAVLLLTGLMKTFRLRLVLFQS